MGANEEFQNQNLKHAAFKDCTMADARFDDVDLSDAGFTNVNLTRTQFRNVNLSDVTITDANIKGLTIFGYDIQTLIREHEAAQAMCAEPQLFTSDMETACRFYTGLLGFTIAFLHGEPPFYAQVTRGRWKLNLRFSANLVTRDGPVSDSRARINDEDALAATLTLLEAKPLYEEFLAAGVTFHKPLITESWGSETFIIADPDGNLIAFAGKPV